MSEGEYEVEKIVGDFWHEDIHYYVIKWKGWPSSENTYEPLSNLENCSKKIKKYERKQAKSNPLKKSKFIKTSTRNDL